MNVTADQLREFESFIRSKIKGQDRIIEEFCNAIKRSIAGVAKPTRPKCNILLLGPTGVGKTQIVLETVQYIYGKANANFQRMDMSEYQADSSIKVLLGENQNEQGILGSKIDLLNSNGGGIFLFDEIEKAHPRLISIFLQIMDCASVTMTNGQKKDLSNIILIFTSNLGSAEAAKMVHSPYPTIKRHILSTAEKFFSPELLARFNEVIIFSRLDYKAQLDICSSLLEEELILLEEKFKIQIKFEEDLLFYLIKEGFSSFHGARVLRNVIERKLGNLLVNWSISKPPFSYNLLKILVCNDKLVIDTEESLDHLRA